MLSNNPEFNAAKRKCLMALQQIAELRGQIEHVDEISQGIELIRDRLREFITPINHQADLEFFIEQHNTTEERDELTAIISNLSSLLEWLVDIDWSEENETDSRLRECAWFWEQLGIAHNDLDVFGVVTACTRSLPASPHHSKPDFSSSVGHE